MQNETERKAQFERDLRIIQSNSVEPVVYQSNHSIVSSGPVSYGGSQNISFVEQITASQSTLSSYLPKAGIAMLNDVASCHIHQVFELNECKKIHRYATRMGSENRFTIKTHDNGSIFLATEASSPRDRMIWGSSRAFLMHLMDKQHQPALVFRRTYGYHCLCFPLRRQTMEVWLHSGVLLGVVQEQYSFANREFVLENERGEILYRMSVSQGTSLCMPKEQHFRILTADQSQQSGTITRQWNTDLNTYTMNIYYADPQMDAKLKSLFLGLGFLLEYLFFQSRSCC